MSRSGWVQVSLVNSNGSDWVQVGPIGTEQSGSGWVQMLPGWIWDGLIGVVGSFFPRWLVWSRGVHVG